MGGLVTSTSEQVRWAAARAGEGNVVAFPGTVEWYRLRAGDEFRWHCPLGDCYRSGRWVKRFVTAVRGLERHVDQDHGQ